MNAKKDRPHCPGRLSLKNTGWKAFAIFLLATADTLQATTVWSDSPDTVVNTRDPVPITVTMHRVKDRNLFENPVPTTGVDEPLRVKAASPSDLAAQPQLPAWDFVGDTGGGLVADGVTPLIFRILATGSLPEEGSSYWVEVTRKWNATTNDLAQPPAKLSLPGSAVQTVNIQVTLTPLNPQAFVVLNPIPSANLIGSQATGPVVASLEVRDSTGHYMGGMDFGVSRPPVALVHGYNVDDPPSWGDYFGIELGVDRAPGFVMAVGYGVADDSNTTGGLRELAAKLHSELLLNIENSGTNALVLRQWAWTRYDAVGHSQGGLLLRYLCSQEAKNGGGTVQDDGFQPWRRLGNYNRGRFNRVVTVGSPHAGSTIAHLAIRMMDRGLGLPADLSFIPAFSRLLQRKFMIDNGAPGRAETVQQANRLFLCDPAARIHALGASIDDSALVYSLLEINNASRKNSLIPFGADGVVDLRSQCASASGPVGATRTRIAATEHVAHSSHRGSSVISVFGTEETETSSQVVAQRVAELLRGSSGAYTNLSVAEAFHQTMNDTAAEIEDTITEMEDARRQFGRSMLVGHPPLPGLRSISAAGSQAAGDQTINLVLDPPDGESPNGPVQWAALVYGPSGVTSEGLTLQASGTYGEQLALTIAVEVQGEVVVVVSFPSTSGKTAIGTPTVVLNRPPGTTMTGIALNPGTFQGQIGAELPLSVSGIYDDQFTTAMFISPENTTFQSSDTAVATVDAGGGMKLVGLGTASITVTYSGLLNATCAVTVLDALPKVTSSANATGTVGQSLSYQITSSQAAQTFTAEPLPEGLTLNAQTGLISGTPIAEGATETQVAVTNANGTGSGLVNFVITGPPGAPTDLALDAGGVSEQKPVGTLVGRFATVDPNPLDTFSYQLVAGTGSTDNALFTITGNQLFTAAVLDSATQSTVSIRVQTTDSSSATFEKAIVLPVMSPPAITRQPDPRRVFTGDSAVFAVEASGLEPLSYQWKKDDVDVPGGNGRILEIAPADPSQAGDYTVTVSNGDGTVTSAAASFVVDPISYEKWLSQVPNATGGPVYEPLGDYNSDGVQNFLEFALGVPPGAASASGSLPFITRDAIGPVFVYHAANGIQPLTYRLMKSTDLMTWEEHVPAQGEVTTIDQGAFTEVHVRVPSMEPKLFLELEVGTQ